MKISFQNPEEINTIKILFKKGKCWYYHLDNLEECHILDCDLDSFLSTYNQFCQISPFHIINFNHVDDYLFSGKNNFLILSGIRYDVTRRYVSKVKTSHVVFLNQKYVSFEPSNKGTWLSRKINKSSSFKVDVLNIKYLIRQGTITHAYYDNGKKQSFYETLKYFEEQLAPTLPFIRIRRNCIININYLSSYKVDSETKTAEVKIDSLNLGVSRRQLPSFKRKIKKSKLTFTNQ